MDHNEFEMNEVVDEAYHFLLDDENSDFHVDDWQSESMYDNYDISYDDYEPSPYDGTYSEE